jgi:acyl dehydratase
LNQDPAAGTYFEDLSPGRVLRSARSLTMTADRITQFAGEFDPHPAHLSEETATATMFGRLCASGWHTAAATNRLIFEAFRLPGGGAGAGVEQLRWLRPVYPGDVLQVQIEILAARRSKSRPNAGVVTFRSTTLNQHEQAVQEFSSTILVPRRGE